MSEGSAHLGSGRMARATMVAAALGFALVLAECALRVLGLFTPPRRPVAERPDLFQADPDVGYRLWRSMEISYRYPPDRPYLIPISSNASGFRNSREFDAPDGRFRILVVGDSFVLGDGVRAEERFTELMEALHPSWRVDNMGMTGYGLDLMLRALEHHAVSARPELVLLCVYTDDFRRLHPYYTGAGFPYAKFALREGQLVSVPFWYPSRLQRTRLAQAWFQSRWRPDRNHYALNEAILQRFAANATRHRFRLLVAFLPGRGDTPEDQERRGFLRGWAVRRDVPYLDLTEPIHAAGVDRVYLEKNPHWNPEGHRVAARELARAVAPLVPAGR